MYKVIDTPWNTTAYLPQLIAAGVETVIRYYNHANSSALPEKQLAPDEAQALAAAGLSVAVVFEQTGGANGQIDALDAASGKSDAAQSLKLAETIGQPPGSAIYFAVDHDYTAESDLQVIRSYFDTVSSALASRYRVGIYGSGTVCATMQDAGLVDLVWLAGATGWPGTAGLLKTDRWALFQNALNVANPLPHDGNTVSPDDPDFGQFSLGSAQIGKEGAGNVPMV